ncbi:MAG TPA: xanthine dehydrogenase family protein [Methylomirabilota bacterium]|nr:xanthine dehydrogenase family protein [Methylomirabilota bacterium]
MTGGPHGGLATRLVGAHVKRSEDPRLITGQGRYLDDIVLPGMLHAQFARSAHAHALIRGVDTSQARATPGVVAVLMEASPADLDLRNGQVTVRGVPDRGLDIAQVARLASSPPADGLPSGMEPGLETTESYDANGAAFSGAVHVASVEVDRDTGRVSVRDYVVVEDCGPVINPMIVEGQIHGALAQGIGEALGERLVYDESGQLLTGTLMEYALPTAGDLPSFTIGHLQTPSPRTPGGHKGMGEGGTVGAPAAIANAVADALRPLGVTITSLPILPASLIGPDARRPS